MIRHPLGARPRGGTPPPTGVTWDPAKTTTSITLSSGNMVATNIAGAYQATLTTVGYSSGDHYAEVVLGSHDSSPFAQIGVATGMPTVPPGYLGDFSGGYAYYQQTGEKYNSATAVAYGATYASGDVIGVRYNASTGNITFYKNGASQGVAYTVTPGTLLYVGFTPYQSGGSGTLKATVADISFLPSGATAWEP